jgi:hypothetical protein
MAAAWWAVHKVARSDDTLVVFHCALDADFHHGLEQLSLRRKAGYMNATGIANRTEALRTGLGPYMNPSDWTATRPEIVPGAGYVAPRIALAASSRAPRAICVVNLVDELR